MYSNYEASFDPRVIKLSDYDQPVTVMTFNESMEKIIHEFRDLAKENSQVEQLNGTNSNITGFLLQEGEEDLGAYRRNYVIGANFFHQSLDTFKSNILHLLDKNNTLINKINVINGLYNSIPIHSRPLAVNSMSNSLLGYLDDTNSSIRRITTINHPLPFSFTVSYTLIYTISILL